MNFAFKVKPKKLEAKTRSEIMSKVTNQGNYCWSMSSEYGQGLTSLQKFGTKASKVRVYNLHKIRGKTKQVKYKTGSKKGQTKLPSKVVRESGWIAYVYDFDIAMLNMLELEVRQLTRNFIIKPKRTGNYANPKFK